MPWPQTPDADVTVLHSSFIIPHSSFAVHHSALRIEPTVRSPFSPLYLILFVAALAMLVAFIQVGLLTIAFDKLGLSASSAFLLLFSSLFGSAINLPLVTIKAEPPPREYMLSPFAGLLRLPQPRFTGNTLIAVNVGGCLIPLTFSAYLLQHNPLAFSQVLFAITLVSGVCYLVSRPIPGLGIGMPIFVAPIVAALVAITLNPEQSAPLAYICGTLGVIVGADVLRLKDIRRMGTPIASIGGAGTFDGIFITGIVAVLLA